MGLYVLLKGLGIVGKYVVVADVMKVNRVVRYLMENYLWVFLGFVVVVLRGFF